jgi:hypothetical protein
VELGQGSTFGEVEIEWIENQEEFDYGKVDSYEG